MKSAIGSRELVCSRRREGDAESSHSFSATGRTEGTERTGVSKQNRAPNTDLASKAAPATAAAAAQNKLRYERHKKKIIIIKRTCTF